MSVLRIDREDPIAILTLERPDKLNALSRELIDELLAAVEGLEAAPETRAVIVTGAGDRAFAAGADIAAMAEMSPAEAKAFSDRGHRLAASIEQSRMPFIAAVNGFALGGGCELALACDFIYASDKARLGQPEINLGIVPGFGGTQRLARRVGVGRARELCMTGEIVDAQEALRIGLIDRVVVGADLMSMARATATTIAAKGPLAIAALKRTILRGQDVPLATANELEATAFAALFGSHDQREGMRAFLDKRQPKFEGR
ncbi:MAG: enoyl-CoA hydratase-related protein [Polyangiaceae bacterium]|nr:enoyl-CoA hydratase-related protein [Polyangiaceae bacterium]